jgi:hypothetical protein
MDSSRMGKVMVNCRANGRRGLGRVLKRLLDEGETGVLRPDWRGMVIILYLDITEMSKPRLPILCYAAIGHICKLHNHSALTQYSRPLRISCIVTFTHAARVPTNNNGCNPFTRRESNPLHNISCIYSKILTLKRGRDSSVVIATRYGLQGPGIESRWGRYFPHQFRPALGPTQPLIQWVPCLNRG